MLAARAQPVPGTGTWSLGSAGCSKSKLTLLFPLDAHAGRGEPKGQRGAKDQVAACPQEIRVRCGRALLAPAGHSLGQSALGNLP